MLITDNGSVATTVPEWMAEKIVETCINFFGIKFKTRQRWKGIIMEIYKPMEH